MRCGLMIGVVITLWSSAVLGASLETGAYVTEGGWGDLSITRDKAGETRFKIVAIGGNAHMCDLSGVVRNNIATLVEEGEKDKPCVIRFTPKSGSVGVKAETDEACRYYCGARAGFEGEYVRPAPACQPASIAKTRAEFKRLYDRKAYSEAVAVLEPVLKNCSKTMYWLDIGWVRNDLALTHAKLGHREICRQLLQPLAEDAAQTDDQIRENYPPSDAENYLPIVKATRTNLKLCAGGTKKR